MSVVTEKRAEISRLREAKSVTSQRGKLEFNALLDGKPKKMLKNTR